MTDIPCDVFQKQASARTSGKAKPNPLKVFRMFLTLHYGSWLVSMFVTGICNGVIWGFLFWHLENIGNASSKTKRGITDLVFIVQALDRFFCAKITLSLNVYLFLNMCSWCTIRITLCPASVADVRRQQLHCLNSRGHNFI